MEGIKVPRFSLPDRINPFTAKLVRPAQSDGNGLFNKQLKVLWRPFRGHCSLQDDDAFNLMKQNLLKVCLSLESVSAIRAVRTQKFKTLFLHLSLDLSCSCGACSWSLAEWDACHGVLDYGLIFRYLEEPYSLSWDLSN